MTGNRTTIAPVLAIGESERPPGEGHGMSRNREPKDKAGLPHDKREGGGQPYSREVDDYAGGVHKPPESQTGTETPRRRR